MDLQHLLHRSLGFFAELCHVRQVRHVCHVRFRFCGGTESARRACTCAVSWERSAVSGGGRYSMPLRRIWLAAISMTLMMKAMAKAQMRLLRTQVCLFCFWECTGGGGAGGQEDGEGRGKREERDDTVRQAGPLLRKPRACIG